MVKGVPSLGVREPFRKDSFIEINGRPVDPQGVIFLNQKTAQSIRNHIEPEQHRTRAEMSRIENIEKSEFAADLILFQINFLFC
jgi:hypothetical protein